MYQEGRRIMPTNSQRTNVYQRVPKTIGTGRERVPSPGGVLTPGTGTTPVTDDGSLDRSGVKYSRGSTTPPSFDQLPGECFASTEPPVVAVEEAADLVGRNGRAVEKPRRLPRNGPEAPRRSLRTRDCALARELGRRSAADASCAILSVGRAHARRADRTADKSSERSRGSSFDSRWAADSPSGDVVGGAS